MVDCIMWISGVIVAALYLRARLNGYYRKPLIDTRADASLVYNRRVSYLGVPGVDLSDFSSTTNAKTVDYID